MLIHFSAASSFGIIILIISILFFHFNFNCFHKEYFDLAICVLSSRSNFELRNAIRNSWFGDIISQEFTHKNKTVIAKFIVGQSSCSIHPENRIDTYGCERWNVSLPETSDNTAFTLKSTDKFENYKSFENIYVKVMHGIVLKGIGISDTFLQILSRSNESTSLDVYVYDAATDDDIIHTQFNGITNGMESKGYVYRPVQEMLLPKGYEFILQLKVNMKSELTQRPKTYFLSAKVSFEESHRGIIVIKPLDQYGQLLHKESGAKYLSVVSFMFSVHSVTSLINHLALISERDKEWLHKLKLEGQQLQKEKALHQDLILVDVLDVYRNLPEKVLASHQWLSNNYLVKYVLKTDDDCFINIQAVLESLPADEAHDMIWWGNFRTNWAVERHGKWAEFKYSSMTYPKFACGSGNVISHKVHSWLVQNKPKLQHFQGEDVSMGIWLAALNVQYVQDDRWQCAMSCKNDLLSIPELSSERLQWHWNNSKTCASPCMTC